MEKNKRYWLFLLSIAAFVFLWYSTAFVKARCICPWNEWGFLISTISALALLGLNLIFTNIWIRKKVKRFKLYYSSLLIASLVGFIVIYLIFLNLLS